MTEWLQIIRAHHKEGEFTYHTHGDVDIDVIDDIVRISHLSIYLPKQPASQPVHFRTPKLHPVFLLKEPGPVDPIPSSLVQNDTDSTVQTPCNKTTSPHLYTVEEEKTNIRGWVYSGPEKQNALER